MHSSEGPSGRTYHHESAGSAEDVVHFSFTEAYPTVHTYADGRVTGDVSIPMRDILWLAAQHVRHVRTAFLEEATDEELLGLPDPTSTPSAHASRTLAADIPPGGLNLSGWFTSPRESRTLGTEEPGER